jgi:hypothetical protein
MPEPYVLHYTSGDLPDGASTWSVYREEYTHQEAEEPIDGSQTWVSRHANEEEAHAEACRLQATVNVPLDAASVASQALTRGLLAVPPGSPHPAPPGAEFAPLSADEQQRYGYLQSLLGGREFNARHALMRVVLDGRAQAAICAVQEDPDGSVTVSPLALLADDALFDRLVPPVEPDGPPFHCRGCGREESACSADPCAQVIADRNS